MYIGIDIAKLKFDAVFLTQDGKYKHKSFKNAASGFSEFLLWCQSLHAQDAHFCMEATGIYYAKYGVSHLLFNIEQEISAL